MENEPTLEAILLNQTENAQETQRQLEAVLLQGADNNKDVTSLIEAHILVTNDLLQSNRELITAVREKDNEPIEIKIEIVGGEAKTVEHEEDN